MNRILCIGVVNSLYSEYKEKFEFKVEIAEFLCIAL